MPLRFLAEAPPEPRRIDLPSVLMEGSLMSLRMSAIVPRNAVLFGLFLLLQLGLFASPSESSQIPSRTIGCEQQASNLTSVNLTNAQANAPNLRTTQAGNVAQQPGAAGGGEGKPEDWGSPKRMYLFPTSYLSPIGNLPVASVLYLLSWWF